jgi:uncharacterized repeat protein (TIGR01451 family)
LCLNDSERCKQKKVKNMFEKLLGLLPYNPSLVHQLGFYSERMREEASIRRIGMVFIVLAFMVQFFAVLSPPQVSTADSVNSLINGGFSTAAEAKSYCTNNVRHYKDILNAFGITCTAVGQGEAVDIHSAARDYYSMGWNPQGAHNDKTGELTHEVPMNIPGAGTLYMRKLSSWDSLPAPGLLYHAIRVRAADGTAYYLLKDCGNFTSVGIPSIVTKTGGGGYVPPAPTPTAPTPTPTPPSTPTPLAPTCQPGSTDVLCKPCDNSVNSNDTLACVAVHKTASNITAGLTDANGSTAQPGDVITYTLFAQNNGKADVKSFVFQENLSDVLDYADVTDLHGGKSDTFGLVSWPAETIKAGATLTHQITVKVKDPIPATPTDQADPMHFDLTMTNVYGNSVSIKVPAPPGKTVETAAATLPNTGPGSSLLIGGLVVMLAGYFYARSRLLATESNIVLHETTIGGMT